MLFSDLLREAIDSVDGDVPAEMRDQIVAQVQDFLQAWVAIHEPDEDMEKLDDPQRVLILQLLEELEDKIQIPIHDLNAGSE